MIDRLIGKKIVIEIKNSSTKIFGIIKEIDKTPEHFNWIIILDKFGKEQIVCDSEISRMEVLE